METESVPEVHALAAEKKDAGAISDGVEETLGPVQETVPPPKAPADGVPTSIAEPTKVIEDFKGQAKDSEVIKQVIEREADTKHAPHIPAKEEEEEEEEEEFPDPDEDDLDDLDDMLDEFTPSKPETKAPPLPTSGPGKPIATTTNPLTEDIVTDEEFAKQLEAGMAELLGGLGSTDLQGQFEAMFKDLSGAGLGDIPGLGATSEAAAGSSKQNVPASTAAPSAAATEESFQETIKKTMERMQASGDQATAAAATEDTDDILSALMQAMQAGGLDGEGGEEDFSKMLLGMMEQLTNKEILYEPMKELDDKFPGWMEKNQETTPKEDLRRYKEQQAYVHEIVTRFELKAYSDENVADREYIVERMQKMQAAGSPPSDLVGDMAAAQEAFGAPGEGCPVQ